MYYFLYLKKKKIVYMHTTVYFICQGLLFPVFVLQCLTMANIMNDGGASLRFVSWNVKGLNGPVKRGRIFSHLKHLKTEIAFLQGTHLVPKDPKP